MLVLDAYKGHLTSEIKATVTYCSNSTDHVVIHEELPLVAGVTYPTIHRQPKVDI
jgi:hypothetical protein